MQTSYKIKLTTIENVKKFVKIVSEYDADMDLKLNRYVIDAKSILGIFGFDLSKDLTLIVHEDNPKIIDSLNLKLKEFIVK